MNTRSQISAPFRRSKSAFERGIHFVYERCIEPRATDEDSRRHEFILNMVLCWIIPLVTILDCFVAVASLHEGAAYKGISFVSFTSIVLVFGYVLLLSRSGYWRVASATVLVLYFSATTYGAIHWGVELPLVAISYIVIIIISSILISTRCAFWVTVATALTIITVTYLQVHHFIHPLLSWKYAPVRLNDPIELSLVFFLVTAVSWLSNKETERSLARARMSEKALLEERNLLEMKVEARTKELKDAQKDKISQLYRFAEFGKLSSGIFHDLMNSLNVVVANVSQLQQTPDHLPTVQRYVAQAVTTSRRLGSYMDTVRKQVSASDNVTTFSLQKEIADALDILHFRSREARVHFMLIVQEDIILHGNAVKFYQIALNLLSNAVDACEEKEGEHTVEITLGHDIDQSRVLLTIRDDGCGVDPAVIENIFTPFFTTKAYGKGIGLGLSQTKEIIEQEFNGTIEVKSVVGKGTLFIITLPFIHHSLVTHESLSDHYTTDM